MTHNLKQRARAMLVEDAKISKSKMSASEWEERVKVSIAGIIIGKEEIERIVKIVWGIGCRPLY